LQKAKSFPDRLRPDRTLPKERWESEAVRERWVELGGRRWRRTRGVRAAVAGPHRFCERERGWHRQTSFLRSTQKRALHGSSNLKKTTRRIACLALPLQASHKVHPVKSCYAGGSAFFRFQVSTLLLYHHLCLACVRRASFQRRTCSMSDINADNEHVSFACFLTCDAGLFVLGTCLLVKCN
jgi:hypothetical protein